MSKTCCVCILGLLLLFGSLSASPIVQKIQIHNDSGQPRSYLIDCDRWAYADLSYRIDGGKLQHKYTGEFVPYRKRDYPFLNAVMIRVELEPGQTMEGELKLEQKPYMGPPPHNNKVAFQAEQAVLPFLWNSFGVALIGVGTLFIILIYNLLFYTVTRNKLYRYYLLAVVFMLLESGSATGLFTSLFQGIEEYPLYERHVSATFTVLVVISMNLFTDELLKVIRKEFAIFNYSFYSVNVFAVLLYLLSWFEFQLSFDLVVYGFPPFFIALIIGSAINLARKKPYSTLVFMICLLVTVATLIHIAGIAGWVYLPDHVFNGILVFSLIIVNIFMTFLLGRIVWDLRDENAIQRERLIQSLQQEQVLNQQVAYTVADIQESERHNFAQRLHDDLQNQLVTIRYAILGLQAAPPKDRPALIDRSTQLLELTETTTQTLKQIAFELMPTGLEESRGLHSAIREFLNRMDHLDIDIRYELQGEREIPLQISSIGFRIVTELVTNVMKHAQAVHLNVSVRTTQDYLEIRVEDDGIGFEYGSQTSAGQGLTRIRANVAMHGGDFQHHSPKGGGSAFVARIPTALESLAEV